MHYDGTIWRPPYEAYSLLIQVITGDSALAGAGCSCTGGAALAGSTFPDSVGLSTLPASEIFFLSSAT